MSAAAQPVGEDLRAQQVIEMLVTLVREGFTGSVELHFLEGRPEVAKKTSTIHFKDGSRDLMRRR